MTTTSCPNGLFGIRCLQVEIGCVFATHKRQRESDPLSHFWGFGMTLNDEISGLRRAFNPFNIFLALVAWGCVVGLGYLLYQVI